MEEDQRLSKLCLAVYWKLHLQQDRNGGESTNQKPGDYFILGFKHHLFVLLTHGYNTRFSGASHSCRNCFGIFRRERPLYLQVNKFAIVYVWNVIQENTLKTKGVIVNKIQYIFERRYRYSFKMSSITNL